MTATQSPGGSRSDQWCATNRCGTHFPMGTPTWEIEKHAFEAPHHVGWSAGELLLSVSPPSDPGAEPTGKLPEGATVTERLFHIGLECELVANEHDENGWAIIEGRPIQIESRSFRDYLVRAYRKRCGKLPPSSHVTE